MATTTTSSSSHSINPLSLVGTGIALGVVHVLTGPDHLSALATLSANIPYYQAFFLGIRWGIGHSTGLVLVAAVFLILAARNHSDVNIPDRAMQMFEVLVGFIMLGLGVYGILRALQKRASSLEAVDGNGLLYNRSQEQPAGLLIQEDDNARDPETATEESPSSYQGQNSSRVDDVGSSELRVRRSVEDLEVEDWDEDADDTANPQNNKRKGWCCCSCVEHVVKRLSAKTLAVLVGIFHGFAGPGGVLGVIPAVQLKNPKLSALYLSSFCISSTLTMGCYATLYGMCTSRLTASGGGNTSKRDFVVECLSSGLSIVVGIVWLVLLALGKLEDVFP